MPTSERLQHTLQVGLDFHRVSLADRERYAVSDEDLTRLLRRLTKEPDIEQAVVLSTCNRVEVYAFVSSRETEERLRDICFPDCPRERLSVRYCEEAVRHLFCVASGTESLVFGEREILGQVRRAYRTAVDAGTTGPVFNKIFQSAVGTAKEVTHRTGIRKGNLSVPALAVRAAFERCSVPAPRVLLMGAGEMGRKLAHIMCKRGQPFTVVNRTDETARRTAADYHGVAGRFADWRRHLTNADVVFTALSSRAALIRPGDLPDDRPVWVFDLGAPRNVSPDCASAENTAVVCVDDLDRVIAQNLERRQLELAKVRPIVERQFGNVQRWYNVKYGRCECPSGSERAVVS